MVLDGVFKSTLKWGLREGYGTTLGVYGWEHCRDERNNAGWEIPYPAQKSLKCLSGMESKMP